MIKKTFLLTAAGLLLFLTPFAGLQANEVITNETIKKTLGETVAFRKSHSVMAENHNRLRRILSAFLTGDLASIKILAVEISASMSRLTTFLTGDGPEAQTEGWRAIAEMSHQAKEIEKSADSEDFVGAYNHYVSLTFQCVKCHQAVRSWGGFPIPKPKEEKQPGPKSADNDNKRESPSPGRVRVM